MNRLKSLRKNKNLSQVEIAKIFNISQTCYSNYELEKRDISTDMLITISNYYNLSIDYILGITDNKKRHKKSLVNKNLKYNNRLREIREDKDLYLKDIAKKLNMSYNGYSQYETDIRDIPTKVLIKLSKYYDVSIDYLLYLTDIRDSYNKEKVNN